MKIPNSISKSDEAWFDYFRTHRDIRGTFPGEKGQELTPQERDRIWDSIREFQLGESSEGRHLSSFARAYSARIGAPFYFESIKLFIREEQRHSQVLGLFMESEGIPPMRKCFVDSVFRGLRRFLGMEVSLSVLLVAEVISLVYYRALRSATGSRTLRRVCLELLRDEKIHLHFHGDRLSMIRENEGVFRRWSRRLLQWFLVTGTCWAVWVNHHQVLRSRSSFLRFWRSVRRIYGTMDRRIGNLSGSIPARGSRNFHISRSYSEDGVRVF